MMYENKNNPPSAQIQKPASLRVLEATVANTAVELAKVFGDHLRVTMTIEGLSRTTIYEIAKYEDVIMSDSYRAINIMVGDKDMLSLDNGELPFDLNKNVAEVTQPLAFLPDEFKTELEKSKV